MTDWKIWVALAVCILGALISVGAAMRAIRARKNAAGKEARLQPSFTTRWAGKFKLPLSDARLTFLLDRYNKDRHDQ